MDKCYLHCRTSLWTMVPGQAYVYSVGRISTIQTSSLSDVHVNQGGLGV